MIFTPWSKKVIPFPSLRHKIQAYQDGKRNETELQWNSGNIFQFSAPPMKSRNPRREALVKIRARSLNKSRYNPMKTKMPNTPEIKVRDLDAIDMDNKAPSPVRACEKFRHHAHFVSMMFHIPLLRSQIGQAKIGKEQRQRQRKRHGRLTYCQIGICLNPNLNSLQQHR